MPASHEPGFEAIVVISRQKVSCDQESALASCDTYACSVQEDLVDHSWLQY